jgi:RimJ/RimL family protein N-acetyltransferase
MEKPRVELRRLRLDDEQRLSQLFARNDVPEVTRWFDPFPLDASSARRIARHRGEDLYLGIWDPDELVGLAMVRGWDAGHEHRAVGVLVDHRHQGRGIGTAATRLVLQELEERRETVVRARLHFDNPRSLRMFESCGFQKLRREERHWLLEWRPGR